SGNPDERRKDRRNVRSPAVARGIEGRPERVENEGGDAHRDEHRRHPPGEPGAITVGWGMSGGGRGGSFRGGHPLTSSFGESWPGESGKRAKLPDECTEVPSELYSRATRVSLRAGQFC